MSFYQVVLNGNYSGQDIKNILWYRSAVIWADAAEFFGLLDALAAQVRDDIWQTQAPLYVRGRGLRNMMPVGYTLESIAVTAFSDAFLVQNDTPVTLAVNQTGELTSAVAGPAGCVILSAVLEPAFGPGIGLPKRGYLAIGPTMEASVGADGRLEPGSVTTFNDLGRNLATNIATTLPPALFFPIRTRITRVGGLITAIGYKDVSGFVARSVVSFRRSRRPEA